MSEAVKKTEESFELHQFDSGNVLFVLLKTSLPIVILMLFNTAYAFVDSLMSSTYVQYGTIVSNGNEVLLNGGTSIGLIFTLMGILIAFEVMIAVGVGLAYTQSVAQKKYGEAQQRHNEAISLIIYIGLIVWLIIIIIGIPYLLTVSGNWQGKHWNGLDQDGNYVKYTKEMVLDGYLYMVVLGIAFIPMQMATSYVRVLRAEGKGDIAAMIPIFTFPINIFFDWLFMKQFGLGIVGAGIATLIASSSGLLMMWIYIWYQGLGEKLLIKLQIPKFRIHKEVVTVILVFAMGSLLRRLFDSLTIISLSSYVGNLDASGLSGEVGEVPNWTGSWTIMTRSINMGTMLALGVAQSMSMLISYYDNSNQKEKIGQTIMYGSISMLFCTIFAFLILFGLQEVLFHAYNPETKYGFEWFNPLSIAFILALLYSIPLSLQPMAVMFYAGLKKPKATLIHSVIFNFVVIGFATLGLIVDLQTGQPLWIFSMILLGSISGFAIVMYFFRYKYKEFMLV